MIRLLVPLAAALGAAIAPPGAAAATWTQPLDRCYVSVGPAVEQRQIARVRAEGFAPNAPVDVLLDGAAADATGDGVPDAVYSDPGGHVRVDLRVPYETSGQRPFSVSVTERANPGVTVSTTSLVTALTFELRPPQAPPSRRVRFLGRGFVEQATVWGHYVFRGQVRRTVRLGHPQGDCGTFDVRRRQIPVPRPRTGRWTLQVDQQRVYATPPDSVFVRVDITVQRVIRH